MGRRKGREKSGRWEGGGREEAVAKEWGRRREGEIVLKRETIVEKIIIQDNDIFL